MDEKTKQPPGADEDTDGKQPVKVQFSLPQLLGSALAAATAAYLGSTLGTAGTIVGAALASIVGAVAGTLYTAGLDRTTRRVGTVVKRGWERVRGTDPSADVEPGEDGDLLLEHHDPGTMGPVPQGSDRTPDQRARTWRAVVRRVAVAALAIFALAFVAVTGLELALGRSLDGGSGTTVGQVTRPRPQPSSTPEPSDEPTAPAPSATPTTAAPEPTVTAEPTPTPEATTTAPAEPTPTPTPTAQPAEPTPTGAPTEAADAAPDTVG